MYAANSPFPRKARFWTGVALNTTGLLALLSHLTSSIAP